MITKKIILCSILFFMSTMFHAFDVSEKKIVVVIASYNNKDWYERNLESVAHQNYGNYHVIYVNDCSPDGTGSLVAQYIKNNNLESTITLIDNPARCGALANYYRAIHSCSDDTIVVILDGDDWLKDDQVLARINQEYANADVWLTYGQFKEYPSGKLGFCQKFSDDIVNGRYYREAAWLSSHPRTSYAGLFKKIRLADLIFNGDFLQVSCDQATMLPMLEMAATHVSFIPDILYVYNCATPISDCKKRLLDQLHFEYLIRSWPKYPRLDVLFPTNDIPATVTLIIVAHDRPQLISVLHNTATFLRGITNTHVIYLNSTSSLEKSLQDALTEYPHVYISAIEHDSLLSAEIVKCLQATQNSYVLLMSENHVLTKQIDLAPCIKNLVATGAYGFYFSLGKSSTSIRGLERRQQVPALVHLWDNVYAWRLSEGEYAWRSQITATAVLYRSVDIINELLYNDAQSWLENAWGSLHDEQAIGLCFDEAPSIKRNHL